MSDKKHYNFNRLGTGLIVVVILLLWNGLLQIACADELFVKTDGSGAACTQGEPCSLQTALAQAIEGDSVYVATGTYTGTGENVITITNGILLYGGWDGSPAGPVTLNPETYPTTLDGENSRRVIHISGSISPIRSIARICTAVMGAGSPKTIPTKPRSTQASSPLLDVMEERIVFFRF